MKRKTRKLKKLLRFFASILSFMSLFIVNISAADYEDSVITSIRANEYIPWASDSQYNPIRENLIRNIQSLNLDYSNQQVTVVYDTKPDSPNWVYTLYIKPYVNASANMSSLYEYNSSTKITNKVAGGGYGFDAKGNFKNYAFRNDNVSGNSSNLRLIYFDGLIKTGTTSTEERSRVCSEWTVNTSVQKCNRYELILMGNYVKVNHYGYGQQLIQTDIGTAFNNLAIDREIQIDISEGVGKVNESIKDMNETLKDDKIDSSTGNSFFSGFKNDNGSLTGIITTPLKTIQALNNNACKPLKLPLMNTGKNLELPCMIPIYNQAFPEFLALWRLITTGFISYYVIVRLFATVKALKNPDNDDIEVADL